MMKYLSASPRTRINFVSGTRTCARPAHVPSVRALVVLVLLLGPFVGHAEAHGSSRPSFPDYLEVTVMLQRLSDAREHASAADATLDAAQECSETPRLLSESIEAQKTYLALVGEMLRLREDLIASRRLPSDSPLRKAVFDAAKRIGTVAGLRTAALSTLHYAYNLDLGDEDSAERRPVRWLGYRQLKRAALEGTDALEALANVLDRLAAMKSTP